MTPNDKRPYRAVVCMVTPFDETGALDDDALRFNEALKGTTSETVPQDAG